MSSTKYQRGSEWRKWDLHIHTPLSIVNNYGGDTDTSWEKFINDLENLPKEFKAIGINDYLFLDGYERVLEFKRSGRLPNIELILPILEFRLKEFAGVEFGKFKRPNIHVIFADSSELELDLIKSQFLASLDSKYTLEKDSKEFSRTLDKNSLKELGEEIIQAAPAGEKSKYDSAEIEGFKNLNLSLEQIEKALDKDCFEEKYFLAIGKTEWESLKWSDSSIATKRHMINKMDFVFTSSESVDQFRSAKSKLSSENVNDILLDCSDAHDYSNKLDSKNNPIKDRIGNCFTWIKADATFNGLRQIKYEPDERVYIGDMPPVLNRVESDKTRYLESLYITNISNKTQNGDIWFDDVCISLNSELVAIIGNKGGGKSAVADILGLVGSTKNGGKYQENFSFLNKEKFKKKGFGDCFQAEVSWKDGSKVKKVLDQDISHTEPETIKYIPQNYFEKLTNEIDLKDFEKELRNVVFEHLPQHLKLGKESFEELEEFKRETLQRDIDEKKKQISDISRKILRLEELKHPHELESVQKELKVKQKELAAHEKNKPVDPKITITKSDSQSETDTKKLEDLNSKVKEIDEKIGEKSEELNTITLLSENLSKSLSEFRSFKDNLESLKESNKKIFKDADLSIDVEKDITFKFPEDVLIEKVKEFEAKKNDLKGLLKDQEAIEDDFLFEGDPDGKRQEEAMKTSMLIQRSKYLSDIEKLKAKLDEPQKKLQEYKDSIRLWEIKKLEIVGDADNPKKEQGTLEYLKGKEDYIKNRLPDILKIKRQERISLSKEIYEKQMEVLNLYREFKNTVDERIKDVFSNDEKLSISFEVAFKADGDLIQSILDCVNKVKKGTFYEGNNRKLLDELFTEVNISTSDGIELILTNIIEYFDRDYREDKDKKDREITDQFVDIEKFYDLIFDLEYVKPEYELRLDGKSIQELSPGEKGALLLVFYLTLDQDSIPLVIDQPEDNLDNKTVYEILTSYIRKAKKHRQIIVVTHNPNLAIGADAEQIIHVHLDKKGKNRFKYLTGSIENQELNAKVVEVLEGTRPAFDKRRIKYFH